MENDEDENLDIFVSWAKRITEQQLTGIENSIETNEKLDKIIKLLEEKKLN